MKRAILITLGFIFLGVGAIGAFLPVLPTTPLVLLAALCFGNSSPRLARWLAQTKFFGPFIDNYRNKTGVSKKIKVKALIYLWSMLLITSLIVREPWLIAFLALMGLGVTILLVSLKTRAEGSPETT